MRIAFVATFVAGILVSEARAQNVSGYEKFPDPYLLLIREPAVQDDLKLSAEQQRSLQQINDEFDGPFLSMRNKSGEVAGKTFKEILEKTTTRLSTVLTREQQARITQIKLQVKGIAAALLPDVQEDLGLTTDQADEIQGIIKEAQAEIAELTKQFQSGEATSTSVSRKIQAARQAEYRDVVATFSATQKRRFSQLLGRRFDASKLGHVKFKAPEFIESGGWINTSQPLRLPQFQGKVVAVHFFAFG